MDFLATFADHVAQPNMLLAAMHDRVLQGVEPALAQCFEARNLSMVGGEFVRAALDARENIRHVLGTRRVQTNEVGRTAFLAPAIQAVAGKSSASLLDVGTSAGLNLLFDSYFLDYGDFGTLGPSNSPVKVQCDVLNGRPPLATTHIRERVGLDRNIMIPSDREDARWLLACVWPDTGRMERTEAALSFAAQNYLDLREGDAVRDTTTIVDSMSGIVVVVTTWVMAYLSDDERSMFDLSLRAASSARDIYWISAEAPGVVPGIPLIDSPVHDGTSSSVLAVRHFRRGEVAGSWVQAHVHGHGRWIWWYDDPVRS